MAIMKKHPLLQVDLTSTIRWTAKEKRELDLWLERSSMVWVKLLAAGILPTRSFKQVRTFHLSILVCGNARIKKLNQDFRKKDKVTDVLSFPEHENLRKAKILTSEEIFLGDLAICHPPTSKQAKEFSIGYWDEFVHLLFHGLLHLIGYDHEVSSSEEVLMQRWESEAIRLLSETKKRDR